MPGLPPSPPPMPKPRVVKFSGGPKFFPPPQNHMPVLFFPPVPLCTWATDHPELREGCIRNSVCICRPPVQYKYRHFKSILQDGPTCGLVALSMVLNGRFCIDRILYTAKELGYTFQGEMFSCKQMGNLAKEIFKIARLNNVRVHVKRGGLYTQATVDRLLKGALLLVPYDADRNHLPCLKKGHTAHWTLICGVVVAKNREFGLDCLNVQVLAKHGKSKYLGAYPLEDLAESNANLMELSPNKSEDDYLLPVGGIGGQNGLKGQYVVIEGI